MSIVSVPLFGNPMKKVKLDSKATEGAVLGTNLFAADGTVYTLDQILNSKVTTSGITNLSGFTSDDLQEGQFNLYFTDRRAQDAVGSILANSTTVSLAYVAGTSITATLNDLADSGVGAALVKITRDVQGRISGTHAATTTDLTEGTNLYYTDTRADARITLQKAQPLGLATLDSGGKLDASQIPAIAISETFVVATQAAMLALTAQEGDVAVRTDLSKSFILTASPASTLANWQELLTPASPVTSVFGRVGSVTASSGDYTFAQIGGKPTTLVGYGIMDAEPSITAGTTAQYWRGDKSWQTLNKAAVGLGNVDNTSDANKPVSTAQAAALAPLLRPQFTDWIGIGTPADRPLVALSDTSTLPAGSAVIMLFGGSNKERVEARSATGDPTFQGKASLGTIASPTAITSGLSLVNIAGSGYDGTQWVVGNRAILRARAAENWSSTANGAEWAWLLTPNGTTGNPTLRLLLSNVGHLTPGVDNSQTLGASATRWSVVYAATGTINTSDAREKTDIEPLTAAEISAASDMARSVGTYQWLESVAQKGDGARHHVGLTVQRAIEIMQSHGLDPMRYGFICYDQWDELPEQWEDIPEELDDTGNVTREAGRELVQEYRPAGDCYSFRTDELSLFLARGFDARLSALESSNANP